MSESSVPRRRSMPLRYGAHAPLESAADELIYGMVKKIKRHSENDILTPWKEKDRRKHEIYVPTGVPDSSMRSGIYHRVTNPTKPELNSREGIARGHRSGQRATDDRAEYHGDSLHSFVLGDSD